MSASDPCSAFFTQNTDINGIGARLAVYLQVNMICGLPSSSRDSLLILSAVLQLIIDAERALGSFWTLLFMIVGLTSASVVSASQGLLSFYNAIQVQNLSWYVVLLCTETLLPIHHT